MRTISGAHPIKGTVGLLPETRAGSSRAYRRSYCSRGFRRRARRRVSPGRKGDGRSYKRAPAHPTTTGQPEGDAQKGGGEVNGHRWRPGERVEAKANQRLSDRLWSGQRADRPPDAIEAAHLAYFRAGDTGANDPPATRHRSRASTAAGLDSCAASGLIGLASSLADRGEPLSSGVGNAGPAARGGLRRALRRELAEDRIRGDYDPGAVRSPSRTSTGTRHRSP